MCRGNGKDKRSSDGRGRKWQRSLAKKKRAEKLEWLMRKRREGLEGEKIAKENRRGNDRRRWRKLQRIRPEEWRSREKS